MTRYRLALSLVASLIVAGCGERELVAPPFITPEAPAADVYQSGTIAQVSALGCILRTDGSILCWGAMSTAKAAIPAGNYRELSVGGSHNCALTTADVVVCWGSNDYGETSPPQGRFAHVSSGSAHSCALGFDGSIVCWGKNNRGQATAPPGTFTQVSANSDYSCGIRTGGTLACWGLNPVGEAAPIGNFSRVSAGVSHACAVRDDGAIVCWGHPNIPGPVESPPAGSFIDVSANVYTCGTKTDRSVVCWGVEWRTWGHPVFTPVPPPPGPFMQVSTGYEHACGLTIGGEMVCWGYPEYSWGIPPTGPMVAVSAKSRLCFAGAEGNGRCLYPTTAGGGTYADLNWIRPLGSVHQVSVGSQAACAVGNDESLNCWGWDHFGDTHPPPGRFSNVSVDDAFACAVRTDGRLACWGDPSRTSSFDATQRYLQVSVGAANSCAIRTDGTLYCWPQSGANTPTGTFSAVSVNAALFSPSGPNYCAIRTDGTLVCWNSGPGTPPPPAGTFTRVSVGSSHACALRTDATIACWGNNANGQAVPPTGQFSEVTAGNGYSCAIRSDRRGVCWGSYVITESSLPINRAPVASAGGPYMGAEGSPVALALVGNDPDGDPLTFAWDFGDGITGAGSMPPASHTYGDNGTYRIRLTVSDGHGGEASAMSTATIANVAPNIPANGLAGPATVLRIVDDIADATVTLRFADPAGTFDSYSAAITCGNGTSLTPSGITSPYEGTCRYTRPGIYTVRATVSDEDGGTSAAAQYQYVLVYDPAGSFVTAGGWFDAPASACPTLCNGNGATKAHFTIQARFAPDRLDAPEGAVKFWLQGKKALDVRTTSLTMLIAWDNHLQLWGPASVNGTPDYAIRISGLDRGANDMLRIELFDPSGARVYDTQWGAPRDVVPTTPVEGGQLTIHPR